MVWVGATLLPTVNNDGTRCAVRSLSQHSVLVERALQAACHTLVLIAEIAKSVWDVPLNLGDALIHRLSIASRAAVVEDDGMACASFRDAFL